MDALFILCFVIAAVLIRNRRHCIAFVILVYISDATSDVDFMLCLYGTVHSCFKLWTPWWIFVCDITPKNLGHWLHIMSAVPRLTTYSKGKLEFYY